MEDLVGAMSRLDVDKSSQNKIYEQLQFAHSTTITRFRSTSSCWDCFIEKHNLSRDVVKNLYTDDDIFKPLNLALMQSITNNKFVKMYTMLLSESIYIINERLPGEVYRGMSLDKGMIKLYKQHIGETVYFYGFTSTTLDKSVADQFGRDNGGWLFKITLERGNRDCVANVAHLSKYPHEKEILIAANAGYSIDDVDERNRTIKMTLVDESKCGREKPNKCCSTHK
eukprot:m.7604 g.7604  ORF g.7604 m.7604 type:complete len:226 (+) comp3741_c0_seq1:260-937(+)